MPFECSPDYTETPPVPFGIPKESFTAFRLMYAPAHEISELGKCVFLGRIPDLWWAGEKLDLLGRVALKSKKKVRRKMNSFNQLYNNLFGGDRETEKEHFRSDSLEKEVEFQKRYNRTTEMAFRSLYWQSFHAEDYDGSKDTSEDYSEEDDDDENNYSDFDLRGGIVLQHESEELTMINPYDFELELKNERHSRVLSFGNPNTENSMDLNKSSHQSIYSKRQSPSPSQKNAPSDKFPQNLSTLDSHQFSGNKLNPPLKQSLFQTTHEELPNHGSSSMVSTPLINTTPAQTSLGMNSRVTQNVKFVSNGNSCHRPGIHFADPLPEEGTVESNLKEYFRARLNRIKNLDRLQHFASRSKRKALKTSYKVKGLMSVKFLKRYNVGDILRIDRMLVIIKNMDIAKSRSSSRYARTESRLGEYYVVLRRGPSLGIPLEVQLFDPVRYNSFSVKPELELELQKGDKINLYSNVEKSFKITEEREELIREFIFIPRFTKLCFMWMFLVQTILGDNYIPVISVQIENTDLSVTIPITSDLYSEPPQSCRKTMELYTLDRGYEVKYDSIIEHLLKCVKSNLSVLTSRDRNYREWSHNDDLWLCFKFFDRLEWISNSDLFLIQNHIQHSSSRLEVRRKKGALLEVTSRDQIRYTRPYPIEGFLSRITNTSGDEYSNFRAFYKIEYFHTADNLLFFSKMYLSVPPSPGNILLDIDTRKEELQMPEIFTKNPFPLDEDDHIPWLESPEFEEYDQKALGEYTRRVQQLTNASAMIDLCTVKEIVPIPHKDILKHHLYFQSLFWHSSSVIINDEVLMDSGFEIVFLNGGKLKLLGPSKFIRDQWVQRLTSLVNYWQARKVVEIQKQAEIKKKNMELFEIKEHIDSNVTKELRSYFFLSSKPNDILFDSSSLSMPTNLIKSGYIYNKLRKHTDFNQRFLVLCPGYLIIFKLFKRSKCTGIWKQTLCFERYMILPLSKCYIYSGDLTLQDLLDSSDSQGPGHDYFPRFYADGWKSAEEDSERCFSIWFGKKRVLRHSVKSDTDIIGGDNSNPGLITMIRKLGFTGKKMTFMCRSRQERESWAHAISSEIDRLSSV